MTVTDNDPRPNFITSGASQERNVEYPIVSKEIR